MPIVDPHKFLERMQYRYATKVFDSTKKISASDWDILERSLILTPSSYGLQPWKFLIITDTEVKKSLTPVSWNQAQVESCSHYVIFTHKTEVSEEYVDQYIKTISDVRGVSIESLQGYKKGMIGDVVRGLRSKVINEWSARQCYIALGNFMTSAAVLGIDTCPMEGIKLAEYDRILNLEGTGFKTVVGCAAGYRSPNDKHQHLKKVRFPSEKVITHI